MNGSSGTRWDEKQTRQNKTKQGAWNETFSIIKANKTQLGIDAPDTGLANLVRTFTLCK